MATETPTERYVLQRELGQGGFGTVVLATDSLLGRRVALKSLRGQDAAALAGEARVLAALRHPNIVQVYDLTEIDGEPYLVLQYVSGRTVRSLLESGPLPPERAVSYALGIAAALAYAHRQGVVHNDVKPENIIVDDDGAALLTDFGVASSPQSATLLPGEAASIAGSLPYIAPEVIQGAAPGPRSDVYALAATLYEMLSGTPPFAGAGAAGMAQRLASPPPRLPLGDPEWHALPPILERALAPQAAGRYENADAFADALAAKEPPQSLPVTVIAPGPSPAVGVTAGARRPGGVTAGVAVALLGVALLAAAAVLLNGDSGGAGATGGQSGLPGFGGASATASAQAAATAAAGRTVAPTATATVPPRPGDLRDSAPGPSRGKGKREKD